eukprot:scaffold27070_cov63-Phaeocystis_antarctica.AAC.8
MVCTLSVKSVGAGKCEASIGCVYDSKAPEQLPPMNEMYKSWIDKANESAGCCKAGGKRCTGASSITRTAGAAGTHSLIHVTATKQTPTALTPLVRLHKTTILILCEAQATSWRALEAELVDRRLPPASRMHHALCARPAKAGWCRHHSITSCLRLPGPCLHTLAGAYGCTVEKSRV